MSAGECEVQEVQEATADAIAAEGMHMAVEWLRNHGSLAAISFIGYCKTKRRPWAWFSDLADMRKCLSGTEATVTADGGSDAWRATVDGIDFECRHYVDRGRYKTRTEVL